MIRRFTVGTAVAAGLALSLTGCLGDSGTKVDEAGKNIKLTAAQVLGRTAQKTGQTDAFKADLSMQMQGAAMGDTSMTGSVQYRLKPELAFSMRFDQMSVAGRSMPGMEQRLVGRTMYIKMPMLAQLGVKTGKPWLKISLDELGKKSGMNLDQLMEQSRQTDPVETTKMLTASKDVREVGEETVDGVKTTHYTGTYRLEDALAKLPAEEQQRKRQAMDKLNMDSMAFDLWVDDQQLPRKMAMRSGQAADGKMTITMRFHDFGKPVQITAPPASATSDFGEMLGQLGNGLKPPAGT
ncbi:hypothetical protein [Actinomadura terrae]|uniref:hypothetical protein n=1 Tax=Actinomadura terrae TaxID=604353 RepID=UPI001FA7FEAE|nr:hypothetical protein [Actinomadura terrae]